MRRLAPLAFTALLLTGAQDIRELTLAGALRLALEQGPASRAADEAVARALARLEPARGALGPQASVGASATRQTRNLESMGIPLSPTADPVVGPFNTYDARLKVTQTLFDPAAVRRLRAAREGRALAEADRSRARQDLLALAARSFVEARRADGAARLAEKAEALARRQAAVARERSLAGTATRLEADRADQAVVEAEAVRVNADLNRAQARRDLMALLALPDTVDVRFAQEPPPAQTAGPAEDWDVRAARARVEAAHADVSAARGDDAPKASASADYGYNGKDLSDMKDTYTLGAQASWTFYDGRQRRGRKDELESRLRESQDQAADVERRSALTLAQAEESARAARDLAAARASDEALAARQAALARDRSEAGAGTALASREAEFALARAADAREEAEALLWTAEIARRRALGRMEDFLK